MFRGVAVTNLNIANDRLSLLLEHCQAFLHPRILLQSLVLPIHQLRGIVRTGKGKEGNTKGTYSDGIDEVVR